MNNTSTNQNPTTKPEEVPEITDIAPISTDKESETFTVKHKRTKHPNDVKYGGRPSYEFNKAIREMLCKLDVSDTPLFMKGELVIEEDKTAELFDNIQVGDVIGCGIMRGYNMAGENVNLAAATYKYKVLGVDSDTDTIKVRNVTFESKKHDYRGNEDVLTFEQISCALAMDFCEVLERDEKPFGVSEEVELKVKIEKKDNYFTGKHKR